MNKKSKILIKIDASQDEHRRCLMYTRQPRLVELANTKPWEFDAHRFNAAIVFQKPEEEISPTGKERRIGKTIVHGIEGGLQAKTMSETLLKDSKGEIFIPPSTCQIYINRFKAHFPELDEHYFKWVRETFLRDKYLENRWGRRYYADNELKMGRVDYKLWLELYRFPMQSDCADNMNLNGFIPAYWWCKENGGALNLQVHDEIAASLPMDKAYDYIKFIVPSLEKPRDYFGNDLVVPMDITVSKCWDGGYEFEKFPGKKEFEERCWEELER